MLWANLHLLFWLSLVPFVTAWMGENHFAAAPVALYGVVLLASGCAYFIMVRLLLADHAHDSLLARAMGSDLKGRISIWIYLAAIGVAFAWPWLAGILLRAWSRSSGWCPTAASRKFCAANAR